MNRLIFTFVMVASMAILQHSSLAQFPEGLIGPIPYRQASDSPFFGMTGLLLEDFEDGEFNIPGIIISQNSNPNPTVKLPSPTTDSVDGDDGEFDGSGTGGHSFTSGEPIDAPGARRVVIDFDESVLGHLPTLVGVVLTDATPGDPNSEMSVGFAGPDFRTIDGARFLETDAEGGVASDRFVGFFHPEGIARVNISEFFGESTGIVEFDHFQFITTNPDLIPDTSGDPKVGPVRGYKSFENSPFKGVPGIVLEDFESGALDAPGVGVTGTHGPQVLAPRDGIDSVDGDDGAIDGSGAGGHSFWSGFSDGTQGLSVTFTFEKSGGALPDYAGIVFTDIAPQQADTFLSVRFLGEQGNTIANFGGLNDAGDPNSGTDRDAFVGVKYPEGISEIEVTQPPNVTGIAFELDHLQFAYTEEGIGGEDNKPPMLDLLRDLTMTVGQPLILPLNAADSDGDPLVFNFTGIPRFASPTDNRNGTGSLLFNPDDTQIGFWQVSVEVQDDGDPPLVDRQQFELTVLPAAAKPAPVSTYRQFSDSPFFGLENIVLVDFENGVRIPEPFTLDGNPDPRILPPSDQTDSVDADDGLLDNLGDGGFSLTSGFAEEGTARIELEFLPDRLGGSLPTHVGIVFTDTTDGDPDSEVRITYLDSDDRLISVFRGLMDTGDANTETNGDRFTGVEFAPGIAKIVITESGGLEGGAIEVDHLQFTSKLPSIVFEDITGSPLDPFRAVSNFGSFAQFDPQGRLLTEGENGKIASWTFQDDSRYFIRNPNIDVSALRPLGRLVGGTLGTGDKKCRLLFEIETDGDGIGGVQLSDYNITISKEVQDAFKTTFQILNKDLDLSKPPNGIDPVVFPTKTNRLILIVPTDAGLETFNVRMEDSGAILCDKLGITPYVADRNPVWFTVNDDGSELYGLFSASPAELFKIPFDTADLNGGVWDHLTDKQFEDAVRVGYIPGEQLGLDDPALWVLTKKADEEGKFESTFVNVTDGACLEIPMQPKSFQGIPQMGDLNRDGKVDFLDDESFINLDVGTNAFVPADGFSFNFPDVKDTSIVSFAGSVEDSEETGSLAVGFEIWDSPPNQYVPSKIEPYVNVDVPGEGKEIVFWNSDTLVVPGDTLGLYRMGEGGIFSLQSEIPGYNGIGQPALLSRDDGAGDLIVPTEEENSHFVFNQDGSLTPGTQDHPLLDQDIIVPGDFDGEGNKNEAITQDQFGATLYYSNGKFTNLGERGVWGLPATATDLDNDGDDDFIARSEDGNVLQMIRNGNGGFESFDPSSIDNVVGDGGWPAFGTYPGKNEGISYAQNVGGRLVGRLPQGANQRSFEVSHQVAIILDGRECAFPGDTLEHSILITHSDDTLPIENLSIRSIIDPNEKVIPGSAMLTIGEITIGGITEEREITYTEGEILTLTIAEIPAGAEILLSFTTAVSEQPAPAAKSLESNATVSASGFGSCIKNASIVLARPFLTVEKTGTLADNVTEDKMANPFETVNFEIVVQNTGKVAARNVSLFDELVDLRLVKVTSVDGPDGINAEIGGASRNRLEVNIPNLEPVGGDESSAATIRFDARVLDSLELDFIANEATASAENASGTFFSPLWRAPASRDVEVVPTIDKSVTELDGYLQYTIDLSVIGGRGDGITLIDTFRQGQAEEYIGGYNKDSFVVEVEDGDRNYQPVAGINPEFGPIVEVAHGTVSSFTMELPTIPAFVRAGDVLPVGRLRISYQVPLDRDAGLNGTAEIIFAINSAAVTGGNLRNGPVVTDQAGLFIMEVGMVREELPELLKNFFGLKRDPFIPTSTQVMHPVNDDDSRVIYVDYAFPKPLDGVIALAGGTSLTSLKRLDQNPVKGISVTKTDMGDGNVFVRVAIFTADVAEAYIRTEIELAPLR